MACAAFRVINNPDASVGVLNPRTNKKIGIILLPFCKYHLFDGVLFLYLNDIEIDNYRMR